jgi:hypothetical protein
MSQALRTSSPQRSVPALPWRDPHTVSPGDLAAHIRRLEDACLADPQSADLRTCLGIAYAMNYDVYKSMDALDGAIALDPEHFWAQLKLAELHYRVRALERAEMETVKALDLATNPVQFSKARTQLQEIRKLRQRGLRDINWSKPLVIPAAMFSLMLIGIAIAMTWK